MAVGTQTNSKLDLKLIDETYGNDADLYDDVLRVPATASPDEIQLAYFDRRSELFTLLAKIDANARVTADKGSSMASVEQQRYLAEKKMDSVVFAVRILGDPSLRKAYNGIRSERTGMTGYALKQSPSAGTANSTDASESSIGKKQIRAVTPTEDPPLLAVASSSSDSRNNWIQSSFSSSLFSSLDGSADEDRNPQKSKRRQKQNQPSPSPNREPVQESHPETKEKRSLWGRKKRKKKKAMKDDPAISLDMNLTDSSATDQEEMKIDLRPILKNPTQSRDYDISPHEAVRRGAERRRNGTVEASDSLTADDDTKRDDDTRTFLGDDGETFATGSVFTNIEDQKGICGGDEGMFGCLSGSSAFKRIANEVSEACEDTLVSVDQVFNAFTLTDKDIKAVKKKIEKAKRQLDN